jgi:DNA (cytosine-5)-methyltransferase 1
MAVTQVLGGSLCWTADNDLGASAVLTRLPGVPNLGDISTVNWAAFERPEILTAGFPCQDVSAAGRGAGLHGSRTGVWAHVVRAISTLRPRLVFLENVRGLLSARAGSHLEYCPGCMGDDPDRIVRALGTVLGDLAGLGFDAEWDCVPASDAGACHQRKRVFILAWDAAAAHPAGA